MFVENYGFLRLACVSPDLKIGNIDWNVNEIEKYTEEALKENVKVILFPELSISAYTMGDLFLQDKLIKKTYEGIERLVKFSENKNIMIIVGGVFLYSNRLFNSAYVIYNGKILGIVPKIHIPNYNEFYEKRWFASAFGMENKKIKFLNQEDVNFGTKLIFEDENSMAKIAIEICEDLWVPIPPSSNHCLNGANLIFNLSASNELVGKEEYRRELVVQQSARTISSYVYASASYDESTSDLVFSNHLLISENGKLLEEETFKLRDRRKIIIQDIDVEKLVNERIRRNSFAENFDDSTYEFIKFKFNKTESTDLLRTDIKGNIFKASSFKTIEKIFNIQTAGLMKRLQHTGIKKVSIGISGGLDSTLALLVTVNAFKNLDLPLTNILAITMPGFGTTNRTYLNAVNLIKELGVSFEEISIKEACLQHFKDIGHDEKIHNLTYENAQARERTQILMDKGFVIGTGNLSEMALGWCTYNADHMSMYAVNAGVPKTLVREMISWIKDHLDELNDK